MITVFLVDDHEVGRRGLVEPPASDPELQAVGDAGTCLILTSFTDEEAIFSAILAGASGYVVKAVKGFDLVRAVNEVGAGTSALDSTAAAALMARFRAVEEDAGPFSGLSDRERTLLGLLGEGLTNRQIAARMYLAEKTVKNYVSRLLTKLGVERRTQAAVLAAKAEPWSHS